MRIATIVLAAFASLPAWVGAQGTDPLAGAWEQTSAQNITTGESQTIAPAPLHVIYSNGHYVQFRAATNRAKIDTPRENRTREQLVDLSNAAGQYGTYQVSGGKFTRRIVSAFEPSNEGREVTADFKIEGDTLIVTGTNAQGQKTEQRFRRLR